MREDRHVTIYFVRLDHHLDGHILVGEVTTHLTLGIAFSAKPQCGSFLDGGLVGLALHLEVGGLLEVVVLDIL